MSIQPTLLKNYQVPPILIPNIEMRFEIYENRTLVHSTLKYKKNPASSAAWTGLKLNGEKLVIKSISINSKPVTQYNYENDFLQITEAPESGELQTTVELYPAQNLSCAGLYQSAQALVTQCEAESFRKITFFLDRPDVLSRFRVTLEADQKTFPRLLSNGNLVSTQTLPNGRHQAVWNDPILKPCYLFAVVAGDLGVIEDSFTTMSGKKVALQIFAPHGKQSRCHHAMFSLKESMKWDETEYGREYDLDRFMIVTTDDFNAGAMENKGLNIFNSAYILADKESARDSDFDNILGVVAHEYFHNWTGNRVTCRDWFQLSLKEGLTVYRDQNFSMDLVSKVKRIEDVVRLRSSQFSEDMGPLAHPVRPESYISIDNFYTLTIYEKGAEVIRMMETLIGKKNFRKGMDLYFERHDESAATVEDFVKAMEDASQTDLTQFKLWYSQAGTPRIHLQSKYDSEAKTWTLNYEQNCPETPDKKEKLPMHIPLRMNLLDPTGKEILPLENGESPVLHLKDKKGQFIFKNIEARPVPSFLRGFSAPVQMNFEHSVADLYFLAQHDQDPFARWEAVQTLGVKTCLGFYEALKQGRIYDLTKEFLQLFGRIANEKHPDQAYLGFLLGIASEEYLGQFVTELQPDLLHQAREQVIRQIAEFNRNLFFSRYMELQRQETGEVSIAASARRALKNRLLGMLGRIQDPEIHSLAYQQFTTSKCMTDSSQAILALNFYATPEREKALQAFYDRWKSDRLVINQWFTFNSMATIPGTLDRVKKITGDPAYSKVNPNNVRSLVGGFGAYCYTEFHTKEGYAFFADQVLEMDKENPQVAARLAGVFNIVSRIDSGRKKLIADELKRILAHKGLSENVYEIVSKTLPS